MKKVLLKIFEGKVTHRDTKGDNAETNVSVDNKLVHAKYDKCITFLL